MYEKLYGSCIGRAIARILAAPCISRAAGAFMDSRASRLLIKPFIKTNNIDLSDVEDTEFKSFNAFFTRRLKSAARPIDPADSALISPCDAFLSVYPIDKSSVFYVKGSPYTVDTLTGGADGFEGGQCLVFRLTPAHYHRYIFPDDGTITAYRYIKGVLHTVRPEALGKLPVFKLNSRAVSLMQCKNLGDVCFIEVGATMVGRIVNIKQAGEFKRGEEKGRFEFGGSTVILLIKKGICVLDNIYGHSEVEVKLGQKIGDRLD